MNDDEELPRSSVACLGLRHAAPVLALLCGIRPPLWAAGSP
jgi:hypothetical protein